MSLLVYYVICVICISKKLKYLKNEAKESKTESCNLGFSSPLKMQFISISTISRAANVFAA